MTEVIPGIHRLALPLPAPASALGHINAYLVKADGGFLLVDTGWNTIEAFDSLQKQMAAIGADVRDINKIVVTHIHPDHYGLAGKLKQLSGARIYLHSVEKDMIRPRYADMDSLLEQIARWLQAHGVPAEELPPIQKASLGMVKYVAPTLPDVTLSGGETVPAGAFAFRVLWTPGHSPGHICLYEPEQKILLSGDHILPGITPNVGLHPQSGTDPLGDYLNSLKKIKQMDISLVLPGHEEPFGDVGKRITELVRHHQQRNSNILAKIKTGPKTAYQIARAIVWQSSSGGVRWPDLPPLDKRLAILETVAHLESMKFAGRVARFSSDSVIYYRKT